MSRSNIIPAVAVGILLGIGGLLAVQNLRPANSAVSYYMQHQPTPAVYGSPSTAEAKVLYRQAVAYNAAQTASYLEDERIREEQAQREADAQYAEGVAAAAMLDYAALRQQMENGAAIGDLSNVLATFDIALPGNGWPEFDISQANGLWVMPQGTPQDTRVRYYQGMAETLAKELKVEVVMVNNCIERRSEDSCTLLLLANWGESSLDLARYSMRMNAGI